MGIADPRQFQCGSRSTARASELCSSLRAERRGVVDALKLREGQTAARLVTLTRPPLVGDARTIAGFSIHQSRGESPSYFYRLDTASALEVLNAFFADGSA
jgi:hypothetical protein